MNFTHSEKGCHSPLNCWIISQRLDDFEQTREGYLHRNQRWYFSFLIFSNIAP
jgi:hypothetical protein